MEDLDHPETITDLLQELKDWEPTACTQSLFLELQRADTPTWKKDGVV